VRGHDDHQLFARVARGRPVRSCCRNCGHPCAHDSGWRCKFVNAGSLGVGDALERYGESRRSAIVQLSRRRVVGGRGTGMQPLRGSRRAVRLEERYGRNRCKVNNGSISPQRKPSRTLVTHLTTRAIQPRTRARRLSDSRLASPSPIVPNPNAWFRRKVRHVWVGRYPRLGM
jgi:hypothetical protein